MPNTSTTELEAVNTMLAIIGEAPVNSITGADIMTYRSLIKYSSGVRCKRIYKVSQKTIISNCFIYCLSRVDLFRVER